MKKFLSLSLFTVMVLVSQSWGVYQVCTGNFTGFCKWELTEDAACDKIAIDPEASWSQPSCREAYNNCKEHGYLYDDAECTNSIGNNDPNFNGGVPLWCQWDSGCQPLKSDSALTNCKKNGTVYKTVDATDVGDNKQCKNSGTWTGDGKDPNAVVLGCCKWSTETNCYPIYSGIDPADGEDGTKKVASCKTGTNKFWAGSGACPTTCPTTAPTYPVSSSSVASSSSKAVSSSSVASSSSITPSSSSVVASSSSKASSSSTAASSSSNASSSSVGASSSSVSGSSSSVGGSSSSGGGNSSSSDYPEPIISYSKAPVIGLSVVHFARNLQIASGKDATVVLFNMHGKQVFSQKVLSGTTTISLEKQRQGVYYAVVRSGSQKQTVKVVLK